MSKPTPGVAGLKITRLERSYAAALEDLWALWTTPAGIEAWWGPEGFAVKVQALDLRPGGELRYAMSAVAPETIAFMEREGMPLTNHHALRFTEVTPPRRLAWTHLADFIPGVAPYEVAARAELAAVEDGVRLVLVLDPMHDAEWTARAAVGWEMELGKLGRALIARTAADAHP
jgi:uncharacterized protein YndB with AHSA1/START domain